MVCYKRNVLKISKLYLILFEEFNISVAFVMRKRVFAHLVGFLVIENGVFLFSMAIGVELPMLINLAIMLDILISILVLGMFLQRMDNDMNTDESDALTSIKD